MTWWQERTQRERMLIGGAGGLLAILIVVQFIIVPLQTWRDDAAQAETRARTMLMDIRQGVMEAESLQAVETRRGQSNGKSDRVTITSSAQLAQVRISRLQPGTDGLTVWIEEVDALDLQRWIASLNEEHGITVHKATIDRIDDRPLVRAQLQFATGA